MELNDKARTIIENAIKRKHSRGEVCYMYGLPPDIVEAYLRGENCGTLRAREVIRLEIGRQAAEKRGERFRPTDKDRYKGTR